MAKNNNLTGSDINRYLRKFWFLIISFFGLIGLLFLLVSIGVFGKLPSFQDLENPKSNLASEVISEDKMVLGTYYYQNRSNSNYEEISPNLVNALVSTEDKRFYDHSGIDFRRTLTSAIYTMLGNKQGGSTITQQLALNLFSERARNPFKRIIQKIQEWIIAIRLEKNYTKDEIIKIYLNTVPFGSNAFGIKSAAKTFFNKTPDKLTIEESALLIGILNAPSFYSPVRNPERAIERRNIVLKLMNRNNKITDAEFADLSSKPLTLFFSKSDHNEGLATYFREHLRLELIKLLKESEYVKPNGEKYDLYRDGLKIYTTINSKMQNYAEEAIREHIKKLQGQFNEHWKGRQPWGTSTEILTMGMKRSDRYNELKDAGLSKAEIEKSFATKIPMRIFTWNGEKDTTMSPMDSLKYYKKLLRSSIMSMDPKSGYIKTWVGGIDYEYFKYDQVTGQRQPGSTFKPFVYAVALDNGWSPCFAAPNVPVTFEDYPGWNPQNYDGKSGGSMTLKNGLANSVNNVVLYLIKQIGSKPVAELAAKMGITSKIDPYPSIALGVSDVSLYDIVGAYSTFANKGLWTEPTYLTRIEDKNGNIIYDRYPKKITALNEKTAYMMLDMMKGVTTFGTGVRLRGPSYRIPYPIAGKTGTTQENSDGWFIGITPDLVSGVWTGCEDRSVHFRSTNLGQGSNSALPVWAIFMKKVYADPTLNISKGDFEIPKDGVPAELDCSRYIKSENTLEEKGLEF